MISNFGLILAKLEIGLYPGHDLFCTLENGYLWGHFPNNFQDRIWDTNRAMKIVLTCFALLICPLSAASAKGKHTNALNHQTYKK